MAFGRKNRIAAALAIALLLSACGGTPLRGREIVRAAFFGGGRGGCTVLLLLADEDAPEGEAACKTAQGQGANPAQALQDAAESLDGSAFYGLMDVVGLPAGCDWGTAADIGELLYREARPAPELSAFLLQGDETQANAEQVYHGLQALEESCGVHCGLQTLFAQDAVCALPMRQKQGYGFALLPKGGTPSHFTAASTAQLAAVLCGQAERLDFTFAGGTMRCRADAEATVLPRKDGTAVQLHLRHLELDTLDGAGQTAAADAALRSELLTSFAELCTAADAQAADPFRLGFWTAVKYGPGTVPATPRLELLFE